MRKRIVLVIGVVAVLAGAGYWWWGLRASAASAASALSGSGTIEAEDIVITSELSGRIKALAVDEGQEVRVGQTLAQIDTVLLVAQLEQARAAVDVAAANLAKLKAGSREEQVTAARAQVEQAQAARDGAAQAYANAQKMLQNPQDLDTQVEQARAARDAAKRALEQVSAGSRTEDIAAADAALAQAQAAAQDARDQLSHAKTSAEANVQQAAQALTQAQATYAAAKANWDYVADTGADPTNPKTTDESTGKSKKNKLNDVQKRQYYEAFVQAEAAMKQAETSVQQATVAADQARKAEVLGIQQADAQVQNADAARAKLVNGSSKQDLAAAQTSLSNAQRMYDLMLTIRKNPIALQSAVDTAKSQLDAQDAALAQAQANLDLLTHGAQTEDIQAAEAQLAQARASQHQIEVQIDKATLSAPRAGMVLSRSLHEGEQASVGTTIMTIGALDTVRLTLYIPETAIGYVHQGQHVNVSVDSFPKRVFEGQVTFIAQEAQFTPRNVQTKDQRTTTVFAVRVELPNTDHALKPGMPADGVILQ